MSPQNNTEPAKLDDFLILERLQGEKLAVVQLESLTFYLEGEFATKSSFSHIVQALKVSLKGLLVWEFQTWDQFRISQVSALPKISYLVFVDTLRF